MKILCITFSIGKETAAGIVFQDIVSELVRIGDEIILISSYDSSGTKVYKNFTNPARYSLPDRFQKILVLIFKKALQNYYWEITTYFKIRRIIKHIAPDIIMVLATAGTLEAINLGCRFSRYLKKKLYIHLVDPVPPPKHWGLFEPYRKRMPKTIARAMKRASLISMNNYKMLTYQQEYFNFNILEKGYILPDPYNGERLFFGKPPSKIIFTFLGTFYGKRTPGSLIKGFERFLNIGNDAELHIIGNNSICINDYSENELTKSKIILKQFTSELDHIYRYSTALIDVDVDFPGDVFCSSKLKRYLFVDRPIILITHINSPSYDMVRDITSSVFICTHEENSIVNAMVKSVSTCYSTSLFNDRLKIIEFLDAKNAICKLREKISHILSTDSM